MNSQLRYEEEFIHYMGHIYCARPSGLPLTPKVISDTTGRLHRIEFVLGVKINEYVKTNEKFIELCESVGVEHDFSTATEQWQNGLAEAAINSIMMVSRIVMVESGLGGGF